MRIRRAFFLGLPLFAMLLALATAERIHGATPSSELRLAWWGGMRAIQYPATERDPGALDAVHDEIRKFREVHPDALLLDVGGFVGPTVTPESSYALPPLPFYESAGVAAVNLAAGDWMNLLTGNKVFNLPVREEPPALLSTIRPAAGHQARGVVAATRTVAGGRPVIVAGTTRIPPVEYMPGQLGLLAAAQDPEADLRTALATLREETPEALRVLLADMNREEAADLASRLEDIDLVLLNREVPTPKPEKIGARTWLLERPPAGAYGVATLRFDSNGRIQRLQTETREFLPVEPPKHGLWGRLGLASAPEPPRPSLAKPIPKPIVAIRLRNPRLYLDGLGFPNATVELVRCEPPQDLLDRIANSTPVLFRLLDQGREVGRLLRLRIVLPACKSQIIVNLVLDANGHIVAATTPIDPVLGMQYVTLSSILKEWAGQHPAKLEITPERYPGIDMHLEVVREMFLLGVEMNRLCR